MTIVKWGDVIIGIVVALLAMVVFVPVATVAGGIATELVAGAAGPALAVTAGIVVALLLCGALYYLSFWDALRRRSRDLALGVLIGAAFATLVSGACGFAFSSIAVHGY